MSQHEDGRLMLLVRSARYGLVVNIREGDSAEFRARSIDELAAEWARATVLWNDVCRDEAEALYANSLIRSQSFLLVDDLCGHGISVPAACDA